MRRANRVPRQAISKWETGEATPELSKLALLAKTFGVTADWLISEDDPPEDSAAQSQSVQQPAPVQSPNWVDSLPGAVRGLVKRYGWLAGVYIALCGCGIMLVGIIAKIVVSSMFGAFDNFSAGIYNGIPGYDTGFGSFAQNNPVSVMATIMIIIGLVIAAAGVALVVYLKDKSKDK